MANSISPPATKYGTAQAGGAFGSSLFHLLPFVEQGNLYTQSLTNVPALNAKAGIDYIGKPAGYGRMRRDEYTQKDYHKVTDEVKPDWDLPGAVEDLRLFFEVGYRIAQGSEYPEWKPGAEFRARREAMLKARR